VSRIPQTGVLDEPGFTGPDLRGHRQRPCAGLCFRMQVARMAVPRPMRPGDYRVKFYRSVIPIGMNGS
jgi:hypothetical protein